MVDPAGRSDLTGRPGSAPPLPVVAVVSYGDRVPSKLALVGDEARLRAASTRERLDAILPEAEIALIWNYKSGLLAESWRLAGKVSWVHVAAAGWTGRCSRDW